MADALEEVKESSKEEVLGQIEEVLGVEYSEEQRSAVYHFGKPLNILSCAGSGKTTTLIGKMLFMEMYYGVSAEKVLAITFNKEAIVEMETRYKKARRMLRLDRDKQVTFRTFHALYLHILKSKYGGKDWNKVGEYTTFIAKLDAVCKKYIKKYHDDSLRDVMAIRSYQINNLLTEDEMLKTPKFLTMNMAPDAYKTVINYYEELKESHGQIDFDDLQLIMYEEMEKNGNLADVVKQAWDYVVVDEYQDISKVQLEILKMMVKDTNKLTTIGDDDQSIYEFRGSKTDYIIDFKIHFPGAQRVVMGTNYRCPANILTPIIPSISLNKKRVQKEMKSDREGGEIKYAMTRGITDSALNIADMLLPYREDEDELADTVILIRNNSQQKMVIDALLEHDIPVRSDSAYKFSNHFIVNDIRQVVELAIDDTNSEAFKKVFTKITQFAKRKTVDEVSMKMMQEESSWRDHMLNTDDPNIHETSSLLYSVQAMVEKDVDFKTIVEKIHPFYRKFLVHLVRRYDYDSQDIADILEYMKWLGTEKTYKKFYDDNKRKDSLKNFFNGEHGTVRVATMHKMKGLEYKRVFLLDLTESVLPNQKIVNQIEENYGKEWADDFVEQERRLFYVAWTRAKEELIVMVNDKTCSRFIMETIQPPE